MDQTGNSSKTTVTLVDLLLNTRDNLDLCCSEKDFIAISTVGENIQHLNELHQKGVKLRVITEITPDNLKFCKDLSSTGDMRHLSGIKGMFLIANGKILGVSIGTNPDRDPLELAQSTVTEIVGQQRQLFEMLWEKAIPSYHRIRELQDGIPIENTELVHGTENIVRRQIESLIKVQNQHDACVDKTFPASLLSSPPVWDMCLELGRRGVLFRTITEITPDNIEYCKQMSTRMNLRHLNDIRGNFSVRDRSEYYGSATMREGEPPTQGIQSTSKVFVDMQQYFFETLWNKAIPAEQRIMEIEEGITPEIVDILSESSKTQDFANNLVKMASKEILVMFASINEYKRQQTSPNGFIKTLAGLSKAKRQKINIRITLPSGYSSAGSADKTTTVTDGSATFLSGTNERFAIQPFEVPLSTKITIIIVDRKYALVIELKDDFEEQITQKSSGLAIYSNSRAIVLSYVSFFELLWTHIALYEELRARELAQKEFIDIAAHELRTPIQPILGLAQEIQARQKETGEGRLLGVILRSASNLQRLADNLLDVARIQNNVLKLAREQFDLNGLISLILADYAIEAAKNKGVGLDFTPSGASLYVMGDRDRLYQVISNVIQNAIKFTQAGQITVTTGIEGEQAVVSVKDTGSGIDPEILTKLFTKFATNSPSTGTGLGLFISKRIVEAHGGKIFAANNSGELGATFTFSIPLKPIIENSDAS